MSASLILHELIGSPNSARARIALGFKGLEFERRPLDLSGGPPGDRTEIIAVSTQPRTPVLRHGDTVIFDSRAILRYLEANFPETPRLYSSDYAEFGLIDGWEVHAGHVGAPIGQVFAQALSPEPDFEACKSASALLNERTEQLEEQLSDTEFLCRDTLSGADVCIAPLVSLAMLPDEQAQAGPIMGFFREHLLLGDGRERTRAWVERVMAWDVEYPK